MLLPRHAWLLSWLIGLIFAVPGARAQINIGNFVWDDANANGRQDAGEVGIPGITVQLWNGTKTSLLQTTTTNANGNYTVVAPGAGSYRVRVLLPYAGDRFTVKDSASATDTTDSDVNDSGADFGFTDVFTLASNVISTTNVDIGVLSDPMKDHTIGDFTFRAAADGTQGFGKQSGVTVQLLNAAGAVLQTTVSDSNGFYSFLAPPGTYRLHFATPAGMVPCPATQGGDVANDSDIDANGDTPLFTLLPGQVRRDLDAGYFYLVNVGNFVWQDANGDGVQNAGEAGVADVVVELWSADKTKRFDATVTNASGNYTLHAPGPGNYRIWVLRPLPTDDFTTLSAGSDGTKDSDINPSGADFGFSGILVLGPNVISITSLDAGLQWGLGRRTITPLRMRGASRQPSGWSLVFDGPVGGTYQAQWSADLERWQDVGSGFTTAATPASTLIPAPVSAQYHFRIRRTR